MSAPESPSGLVGSLPEPMLPPVQDPAPELPDYALSPNAVLKDEGAEWRYGHPPDYSKTRKVWEETKQMNHEPGSLEQIVENIVKNWEIEASFKSRIEDWRTIDHANYSFAMNGGVPSSAEQMIKTGTYNAIIAPNEFYDPRNSDFASSHKTFKRMMPTFAWEVTEVLAAPPKVVLKWRHWGEMKNDYVGFNDKGEKVTVKAHGGMIDIKGVTVAVVDEKLRLQAVETFMDPLEMFRQIAPDGIVNKQPVNRKVDGRALPMRHDVPGSDGVSIAQKHNRSDGQHANEQAPADVIAPHISNTTGEPADEFVPAELSDDGKQDDAKNSDTTAEVDGAALRQSTSSTQQEHGASSQKLRDAGDSHLEQPSDIVHPHPKLVEEAVAPSAGQAVAATPHSDETGATHEEMSRMTPVECPFLMNRE